MSPHDHGHDHGAGLGADATEAQRGRQRRALLWSLVANAAFLVVEVVGGLVFGSLALLADAAHMGSDVAGLVVALVAQSLMSRPATDRHSYGLARAEVLGAQANGVLLVASAGWVLVAAIGRFGAEHAIDGGGLLVVATAGLLVNVASAVMLARARGRSLNMKGALVHMLADAAGSVAAMAAGVAVLLWDATWVDPAASILIAVLVLWSAVGLLRSATRVLLEGVPAGLDPDEVRAALAAQPGVEAVHHLHLWSLASDTPAASVHVVLDEDQTLHQAQERGDVLRHMLADRFEIAHVTLELECHPCEPGEPGGVDAAAVTTGPAEPGRSGTRGDR